MTAQTSPQNRYEMKSRLVAKAWKDEAFKQQLLSNPKATIEEFGVHLPEQMNVQVIEEDANTLYITMPVRPDFGGAQLSDQELEAVAGGGISSGAAKGILFIADTFGATALAGYVGEKLIK